MLSVSIRRSCPGARIIQCSNHETSALADVDEVFRIDGDPASLMTFRLRAFSGLQLEQTAIYLDTDMLILSDFDPKSLLGQSDVCVCKRTQDKDLPFNPNFKEMNLTQYRGLSVDQVYPYVACFTITKNYAFWADCYQTLLSLEEKFQRWYGDQEAMKILLQSGSYPYSTAPESEYGCLPEYFDINNPAKILHFKGPQRKAWMEEVFQQVF